METMPIIVRLFAPDGQMQEIETVGTRSRDGRSTTYVYTITGIAITIQRVHVIDKSDGETVSNLNFKKIWGTTYTFHLTDSFQFTYMLTVN